MRLTLALLGALACACQSSSEPTPPPIVGPEPTPHVRRGIDADAPIPPMESLAFMVGRWEGTAFGGKVEETWGPSMKGTMLGSFRLVEKDGPSFYELMVIREIDGRPTLQVKHFYADLTPWETGKEAVDFPLLAVEGQTAWFDGLTWKRDGDHLLGYLSMSTNGRVSEVEFKLHLDPGIEE